MSFTENIRNHTEETLNALRKADAKIAELKTSKKKYSAEYFAELMGSAQEDRAAIIRNGKQKVQAEIDNFKADTQKRFSLNGADLNADDVALLKSGINLSGKDLEQMLDRNESLTMKTLIAQYAKEHDIETGRKYTTAEDVCTAADFMNDYYRNAVSRPDWSEWTDSEWFNQHIPDELK